MSYSDLLAAEQRLVALRILQAGNGYSTNESILRKAMERWGLAISRDALRTMLGWLAEQGLVTITDVSGYMVAKLTQRGADVATGVAPVPGVERPGPGAA